jgi:hypothetical protein
VDIDDRDDRFAGSSPVAECEVEHRGLPGPSFERVLRHAVLQALVADAVDVEEPAAIPEWQRMPEDGVRQAEHDGRGGDANRQRQDDEDGDRWVTPPEPECVSDVLQHHRYYRIFRSEDRALR